MFSRYGAVLFESSSYQGTSGEVVCSSEQPSGSLLDGQNGFLRKELFFHASDLEVVRQVSLHVFQG